jgi:transcriptional regulator with XRE-family HTH domain
MGFGENVRELRRAAGYRYAKDFAAALGKSTTVVSKWENDRTGLPETPTLFLLAKALGVSINRLLRNVDPAYDDIVRRLQEPDASAQSAQLAQVPMDRSLPSAFVDDDEALASAHPSDRLARIANDILEVGTDLRAWRPTPMARELRSKISPHARQNRKGPRRKLASKTPPKRS